MTIYSTQQMLNQVIEVEGKCLECVKILGQNIYSTYFIAYKKTFKNGKIRFLVDYDNGEEVWTNFDFENLKNYNWKIYDL
jgi:hypothetical protein